MMTMRPSLRDSLPLPRPLECASLWSCSKDIAHHAFSWGVMEVGGGTFVGAAFVGAAFGSVFVCGMGLLLPLETSRTSLVVDMVVVCFLYGCPVGGTWGFLERDLRKLEREGYVFEAFQ